MDNIDTLLATLKRTNPTHFGFDQQGRFLLKGESSLTRSSPRLNKSEHLTGNAKKILFGGLIHPEDRISRKPVISWLFELVYQVRHILENANHSGNSEEVATIFNIAALVFSLMGQTDKAKQLCFKQIDYFSAKSKKNGLLLKHCIQPWINLGRIDRILGEYDSSIEKFNLLLFKNSRRYIEMGSYELDQKILIESIRYDRELSNAVNACAIIEPIKTYLKDKKYKEIISLSQLELSKQERSLHGVAYESLIIASVNLDNPIKAYRIAEHAIENVFPYLIHIFHLRLGELLAANGDLKAETEFNKMLELLQYYESHTPDLQAAVFSARTASQFLKCGFRELAFKAYGVALNMAEKVDDELLKIECLEALFQLSNDINYRNYFHNIINHTGYAVAIRRYCNGLLKVDKKAKDLMKNNAQLLFNKLMSIN